MHFEQIIDNLIENHNVKTFNYEGFYADIENLSTKQLRDEFNTLFHKHIVEKYKRDPSKAPTNLALLSATVRGHLMNGYEDYKEVLNRTEELEWCSRSELFEKYLNAIGIFGYGEQILSALNDIDKATGIK